jgi:hypothetical protein
LAAFAKFRCGVYLPGLPVIPPTETNGVEILSFVFSKKSCKAP